MTRRIELTDATVREWAATVLHSSREDGIVLDWSAFYPGGGGQPPDAGVLLWGGVQTRILGARQNDDVYLIPHDDDPLPPVGGAVQGALDDKRRSMLMRTHSGMHVLSAVVFRDFAAKVTGSSMDPGLGRMDFNLAEVPPDFKSAVEGACNAAIQTDYRVQLRHVRDLLHRNKADLNAVVGLDREHGGAEPHRGSPHPPRTDRSAD